MLELDGLVVATEGDIQHGLENATLGSEQAVDRRRGYAGLLGDLSHGRGRVTELEEEAPGRLPHLSPGSAGRGLSPGPVVRPLDIHIRESNTLIMRVLLSRIREEGGHEHPAPQGDPGAVRRTPSAPMSSVGSSMKCACPTSSSPPSLPTAPWGLPTPRHSSKRPGRRSFRDPGTSDELTVVAEGPYVVQFGKQDGHVIR